MRTFTTTSSLSTLCLSILLTTPACMMDSEDLMDGEDIGDTEEIADIGDTEDYHAGELVAEVTLPNGNQLSFFRLDNGDITVQEAGRMDSNSVGLLAELENATPYEMFLATAPIGAKVPTALLDNHEAVLTLRREEGVEVPGMRPDFHIDEVVEFEQPADGERYFNGCTDYNAWRNAGGTWTNCYPSSYDFKVCETNKRLSAYDNENASFIPYNHYVSSTN
ncbi:MAG: hypothetical protein AAGC55_22085, partial [Myxococcota bacterium]